MSPWIAPRNGGYGSGSIRRSGPMRKDTVVPKGRGGASQPSLSQNLSKKSKDYSPFQQLIIKLFKL